MKKIVTAAIVSAFIAMPTAQAADLEALKGEAMGVMKGFGGELKAALGAGMGAGGPVVAIGACNDKAPGIAKTNSANGWTVGRTSLKLRNAGNEPDAWELKTLNEFEARKAAGENPGKIAKAEVVDGEFRFMKAIPTAGLCLHCHGAELKPEVAAKLDEMYPSDKARGFNVGDIRGAFTLRKSL